MNFRHSTIILHGWEYMHFTFIMILNYILFIFFISTRGLHSPTGLEHMSCFWDLFVLQNMVIGPLPLRFWLPLLIRPLRTFFSHNISPKNYGIPPKSPREWIFRPQPVLQTCRKHVAVAILLYFDSPGNLGHFIYFHLLLWS